MRSPILYGVSYSPWSLRARWALDHHHIVYETRNYTPIFSAPLVRARTGRWRGRLSMPLLHASDAVCADSWEILLWAEAHGAGPKLLPAPQAEAVAAWHAVAEDICAAGRALAAKRTLADRAARVEALPPFVPRALRSASAPIATLGAHFLAHKYGFSVDDTDGHRSTQVARVATIRAAIDKHGGAGLLGEPCWADVAVALSLEFVSPHATLVRHGPATRAAWTTTEAADPEVLAWRDRVIATRPPRHRASEA